MLQKTVGVVLHVVKYNDLSNIVEMYTNLFGRASFLVAIPRSKRTVVKSVLFQPLSVIAFEADYRPTSRLNRIKEAKPFFPFVSIPYDPYKSVMALFLTEFLLRALREEVENASLFAYLIHSIRWLDEDHQKSYANFHLVFLMRLTRFLGLYPDVESYRVGDCFDLQQASFCLYKPFHSSFISSLEASRLQKLMRMNYDTMHLFLMNRVERNRCLEIIVEYYRLHVPEFPPLKSLAVLQELFD